MNYYIHHIGDYAEATSHLSLLEDGVYSRLLRKYYATEQALPANVAVIARQINARTEEERAALDAVLQDFFCLQDDGWHQERCDAEIELFRAKVAGTAEAKENAKMRQRRARDRRKALFDELRARRVVPSYSTTTPQLAEILARLKHYGAPAPESDISTAENTGVPPNTGSVTRDNASVTRDTTGSPYTKNQTPNTKNQESDPAREEARGKLPPGFQAFWKAWPRSPRKGSRGKCADVWIENGYEAIASEIVAHVEARAQTSWVEKNGAYVEAPLVYLNQRRWEGAELPTPTSTQKSNPAPSKRHEGFSQLDHEKGINEDGSLTC